MKMVQMNVRIPKDLKESGDAAIKKAGLNPSEVVRNAWLFAANNKSKPDIIKNFFSSLEKPKDNSKKTTFLKSMNTLSNNLNKIGINPKDFMKDVPTNSNSALRDYIYESKADEMRRKCS